MPTIPTYAEQMAAVRATQAEAIEAVKTATEALKEVLDTQSALLAEPDGPRSPAKNFIENFNAMITGQLIGPLADMSASYNPPIPIDPPA